MGPDEPSGADPHRVVRRRNEQRRVRPPRVDCRTGDLHAVVRPVNGFSDFRRRAERRLANVGQRRGRRGEHLVERLHRAPVAGHGFGAVRTPGADLEKAIVGERQVFWSRGSAAESTPIYDRARLQPGHHFAGPAIVEQLDSTTLIGPGHRARLDEYRNLMIELG